MLDDDPTICGDLGPRIGDDAPRCVRSVGHDGKHQPHASWTHAILDWGNASVEPLGTKQIDGDAYEAADATCYWFRRLAAAKTLTDQAHAITELANHISDLESWLLPEDRYENLES